MSVIRYGRVWGNLVRTNSYQRQAVYNGPDYIFTRHVFSWRMIVNPETQAEYYTQAPPPARVLRADPNAQLRVVSEVNGADPLGKGGRITRTGGTQARQGIAGQLVSLPGQIAAAQRISGFDGAVTSENLKHSLMQPRQVLQWWLNGQQICYAPLPGFVCDSNNGPLPIACNVTELHGSRTFMVDFDIEYSMSECPRFSRVPNPILSNTWSCTDELDSSMMCTRTYEGTTVFDAALTRTSNVYGALTIAPDQLRLAMFPAIPTGFKRESIKAHQEASGTTIRWRCVDRETNVSIGDEFGLVTDVQASHTILLDSSTADMMGAAAYATETTAGNAFRTGLAALAGSDILTHKALAAASLAGGAGLAALQIFNRPSLRALDNIRLGGGTGGISAVRNATLSRHVMQVRVTGKKLTNRAYLERVCQDLMEDRFVVMKGAKLLQKAYSVYDLTAPAVEAYAEFLGGPIIGYGLDDPLPQATRQKAYRWEASSTARTGTVDSQSTDPVLGTEDESTTPHDGRSRGSSLAVLVTGALTAPCDKTENLNTGQPASTDSGNPPAFTGNGAVAAPGWPLTAPRI